MARSLDTAEKILQLNRLRRRRTQQRYRKRLEDKTLTLAKDVANLGAEVQRLEKTLRAPPCDPFDSTPWRLVVEFFRVFRNGLEGVKDIQDPRAPLCLPEDHDQKRFLCATMTPNVAFNNGYGVDVVLEDWRFRSVHHEKIQVRLVGVEEGAENMLIAYLSNLTTITEKMLRQSLYCVDGTLPTFTWKLIGRQHQGMCCGTHLSNPSSLPTGQCQMIRQI
ncbi:hypothetical protein P3T76_006300 [Phytophthora citrophthora]|uniref:BZIP domain-containing protein n=1 Tax=Phytophthora citrophthora TaxID=4793 RepID=A0AAD9LM01_9STRA|nr:hypothetical protein P3T76_006300 [Phytophthora citrophthora]